jgi:hypothetical protein
MAKIELIEDFIKKFISKIFKTSNRFSFSSILNSSIEEKRVQKLVVVVSATYPYQTRPRKRLGLLTKLAFC